MAENKEYWLVETDQGRDCWSVLYDITDWEEGEQEFVKAYHGKSLGTEELEGPWGDRLVEDFLEALLEKREDETIWSSGQDSGPIEVSGTLYWTAVFDE